MSYRIIESIGLGKKDIEEIYQESFTIFLEKVQRETFQQDSELSTYLISICKNQAFVFIRKSKREISSEIAIFENNFPDLVDDLNGYGNREREKRAVVVEMELDIMKSTRKNCYEILRLSMKEGKKNATIARMLGAANEDVIAVQKSRCLSYLKKAVFKRMNND